MDPRSHQHNAGGKKKLRPDFLGWACRGMGSLRRQGGGGKKPLAGELKTSSIRKEKKVTSESPTLRRSGGGDARNKKGTMTHRKKLHSTRHEGGVLTNETENLP